MHVGRSLLLTAAALFALHARAALADPAANCARLAHLKLADTRIQTSVVEGPGFKPPGTRPAAAALFSHLPPFCRVTGVIRPAVRFEVWLPLVGWNGRFQGTGNGGYNGAIVYTELAAGLMKRYATANTDMGHVATTPDPGRWALHHPELVIDEGYRAQHETALKAKAIVRAFYGRRPRYSYFVGCSSGGWEALTEAHRYPHDYNGIIAGAPASDVVHLHAAQIWGYLAATQIPPAKLRLAGRAVLAQCDALDGVKDGLISDPLRCDFKPAEIACHKGQPPDTCLTPREVTALQKLYDGAHFSSGAQVYPGWPRGAESALVLAALPGVAALASSTFRDMVFENPDWDLRTINYDRDVKLADEKIGAVMNDGSTDLDEFRRAGGKLILWHGWSDPFISPLHTLEYYRKLARHFAKPGSNAQEAVAQVSDFARLFFAPGVYHCGGGPGPGTFDAVPALQAWVEKGVAPEKLIAAHLTRGKVDRTRPLCPFPRQAVYDGKGDINKASSFRCR